MSYITVQEAAERWDVSERRVQMFCREGRIPGAFKRNSAWMIPESTQRPDDPRRNTKKRRAKFLPMPLMNTDFTPGCAAEVVKTFKDPRQRDIASAELYYFSGHAEAAAFLSEPYLDEAEPALRLSASMIFAYANLALGQIHRARAGLDAVQRIFAELDDDTPDDLRVAAVFVVTTASVLLHLPLPEQLPDLRRSMNVLPAGLRQFAFYVQAHRTYLEGDYARSLGLVEAAFAIDQDDYPIPAIYLHLVAVMNAVSLKDTVLAEKHLLAAGALPSQMTSSNPSVSIMAFSAVRSKLSSNPNGPTISSASSISPIASPPVGVASTILKPATMSPTTSVPPNSPSVCSLRATGAPMKLPNILAFRCTPSNIILTTPMKNSVLKAAKI